MFRVNNIFRKFFETKNAEQLQEEKQLKEMTVKDVVRSFECKKEIKMENNTQMEEKELQEIQVVEDAPIEETVSEETEVVEEIAVTEEEVIEPTSESDVETEVVEEEPQEEIIEGQEEPQAEEVAEEQPEVCEECGKEICECENAEEPAEVIEEQPQVEPAEPIEVAEVVEEQAIEAPENLVKSIQVQDESVVIVETQNTSDLLKEIEQLKQEKAEQEIAMQKMNLAKEVEQKFAGVSGKTEDKVEMIYELQNSALSENTKSFILNSLELLSNQNLKDCQEIGHSQEVEVDEVTKRKNEVEKAMQEHGLTENQAILFVNGDRTLAEAKKVSARVQAKRK